MRLSIASWRPLAGDQIKIPFPAEKGSDPGSSRLLPLPLPLLLLFSFDLPWQARTETVRGR
ncbi:hypothetical protein V2V59_09865, partial [Streptococcus agalactiae]